MRFKNSLRNTVVVMIYFIANLLFNFVSKNIFLNTLGAEYNGISSLFNNIVSMLSIAELGFGSAIVFQLYEPIAKNNISLIQSLMCFYRKVYRMVALIIFFIGLLILPFISSFVGKLNIEVNIYFIFFLYLLGAVVSYLFTYNRSIIIADQKNYIITLCDLVYKVSLNIIQILILIYTHNFIFYLSVQIILTFLENIFITKIAINKYPYLRNKEVIPLSKKIISEIYLKVKGLLFHKIGSFIVLGTDNILISKFVGIVSVGIYNNYMLIINSIISIISLVMNSLVASVGNLIVTSTADECYKVYKRMLLIQSWLTNLISAGLIVAIQTFITIWVGEEYLLNTVIVIMIILNFYVQNNRKVINTFKESAGIYHEDRYIALFEAVINLIFSILLGLRFGITGIIGATVISTSIVYLYSYPKFVYKSIFNKEIKYYFKELIFNLLLFVFTCIINAVIILPVTFDNLLITFVIRGFLSVIITTLIHVIIFKNSVEFKYWVEKFRKSN